MLIGLFTTRGTNAVQQLCGLYYCDCQYKMVASSVRFSRVFITQKRINLALFVFISVEF